MISQITASDLSLYATVPISFWVTSRYRVEPMDSGLGGLRLTEEPVLPSYHKDYDRLGGLDTGPTTWPDEFDVSRWALLVAFDGTLANGAAALAYDTPG